MKRKIFKKSEIASYINHLLKNSEILFKKLSESTAFSRCQFEMRRLMYKRMVLPSSVTVFPLHF